MSTKRVVSLIASSTEIVCALGFQQRLVGRSHECDFPPSVKRLPVCTAPKLNPEASSQAIDQEVKRILRDGLSVYRVDADQLKQLQPDLILTQTQCAEKSVQSASCELPRVKRNRRCIGWMLTN